MIITWTAPDDRGSTIYKYTIQIRDQGATQWLANSNCNGATASIVAARTCQIPMTDLIASPYSYTFNTLIVVRMYAENYKGISAVSASTSTGATAKSLP
jgi:hypothetical protein